ncbi:hypothetical protein K3495_g1737 [Podosphaera aphanis]|nr:hypothetical protein K3495_g1737 [Podosphaera aphanis]
MPRTSEKIQTEEDQETLLVLTEIDGDHELQETVAELLMISVESRHLRSQISTHRYDDPWDFERLFGSPDDVFRYQVRKGKVEFVALHNKIQDHPVFHSNSNQRQIPVKLQLALTLEILGANRDSADVTAFYGSHVIGKGTVVKVTRVITASLSLQAKCLHWPDQQRRAEISTVMESEGFAGRVGFVDGTLLRLRQRPGFLDGDIYYDRKRQYSLNVQIVCDCDNRITSVYMRFPGSSADSTAYSRMIVSTDHDQYFSLGQYLIADKAYTLAITVITPFTSPERDQPENIAFNSRVVKSWTQNENTISEFKTRLRPLQELRLQLNSYEDMEHINSWVVACVILHSLFSKAGDRWYDLYRSNQNETRERTAAIGQVERTQARAEARDFRNSIRKNTLALNP